MKKRLINYFLCILLLVIIHSPAVATDNYYKLGPGDLIEISVWQDENLSRQLVIPPDGIIAFPLVGDIDVNELTIQELRVSASKKIKEYVTDAQVTVMLLGANSLTAYVVGKVNKPGQFLINMETDVMQLIGMAGDLTPFASPGNIIILRREKGTTIAIPFNYNDVKSGDHLEQNIFLKRGDVVVVP